MTRDFNFKINNTDNIKFTVDTDIYVSYPLSGMARAFFPNARKKTLIRPRLLVTVTFTNISRNKTRKALKAYFLNTDLLTVRFA